jgi:diguanylate cyclase (GGDEF)-like protein
MNYKNILNSQSTVNKLVKKISLIYLVILVFGLIIISYIYFDNAYKNISTELKNIGDFNSQKLTEAFSQNNGEKIQNILNTIQNINLVTKVYIYDFPKNKKFDVYSQDIKNKINKKLFYEKTLHIVTQNDIYSFKFRVESSYKILWSKIKVSIISMLILVFIQSVLMISLIAWIFNRFLSQKLNALIEKVTSIDFKNIGHEKPDLEITCEDIELRNLESRFNDLLDELICSQKNLKDLNSSLDEKIKERTKQLELLSITDELTKTYNRRFLNEVTVKEIKRAQRDKKNFIFAILDVDNFKLYNDTYGHNMGDEVLKEISKVLLQTFKRGSDYVFRMGGEEFGVIFNESSKKQVESFLNLLVLKIENLQIKHEMNTASDFVTASIGCFIVPFELEANLNIDFEFIYEIADNNLYQAKNSGRNRAITTIFDKNNTIEK